MNETVRHRINLLRPLLKDADQEVRAAAARAIEHLEIFQDLDTVLHSLRTGNTGAKIAAIYALGKLGGEKVIKPLVYCAGRPELDIRAAAVETLGRLAEPSTLPILLERLNDQNSAIQARAIAAVGNFPPSPLLCEKLRQFLRADDGHLEAEAALALAHLGDRTAVTGIAALLASRHASTRTSAATALSQLPV